MDRINVNTPIEKYSIGSKEVYVKRDDLMGDGISMPSWGKLDAIRNTLISIKPDRPLIHLSVYGSWSGWALSELSKELGYEFIMAYPDSKKYPKSMLERVEKVLPLRPNMMSIVYNKVGAIARERGYMRLPYAFDHSVYIETQQKRFQDLKEEFDFDHLVVSSGSGVSCLGMLLEHQPWPSLCEPENDEAFHPVSQSEGETIRNNLRKHAVL